MGLDMVFISPDDQMKLKFARSIDSHIDEITVGQICKKAGLSRQTFYKHFKSKYDISQWYAVFMSQFYLAEIGRTYSWHEGHELNYQLVLSEKEYVIKASPSHRDREYSSINTAQEMFKWRETRKSQLFETYRRRYLREPDGHMAYCMDMYTRIEAATHSGWVSEDMKTSPEVLTEYIVSCVPKPLFDALELPV